MVRIHNSLLNDSKEGSSAVLGAQLLKRMVHWNKLNMKQSVDVGFWNFQECADFFLLAT